MINNPPVFWIGIGLLVVGAVVTVFAAPLSLLFYKGGRLTVGEERARQIYTPANVRIGGVGALVLGVLGVALSLFGSS